MLSEKTGYGEVINIGTGITTTMEEIANTIGGEVKFIPRRNFEVEAHQANMSNCYKLLDWRPKNKSFGVVIKFCKKYMKVIKNKVCRMCSSTKFDLVINLGQHPLVNSLISKKDIKKRSYFFNKSFPVQIL